MTRDALVLGCSSFARRRVLPALATVDAIGAIHVASERSAPIAIAKGGRWSRDYTRALDELAPASLVYVSLQHAAHAHWVLAALDRGHHVVVDKPAAPTLDEVERLVARARDRGLVLAESVSWPFHPVVDELRALFRDHGAAPSQLTATFTAPLADDNWRHRDGGALADLGTYAVSVGRVCFGAQPEWLAACVTDERDGQVTAFSLAARQGRARALVGHFGHTVEYRNWLHLAAPGLSVEVPGIFSIPPDATCELTLRARDQISRRNIAPASAMARFLASVLQAIAIGDTTRFAAILVEDARARDRLGQALVSLA